MADLDPFITSPSPGTAYKNPYDVAGALRVRLASAIRHRHWNEAHELGLAIWVIENAAEPPRQQP